MYYLNIIGNFSAQDIVTTAVCEKKTKKKKQQQQQKIKNLKADWKKVVQNARTKKYNFRIL